MKKLESLKILKKQFDIELERSFDEAISDAKKKDKFIFEALKYVKKVAMAGGKRLRPALMYYGYVAAGGKEKEKMIKAAVSIEFVHNFLLIHDDIMDRDDMRHNLDTVNFRYSKIGKKIFNTEDNIHFGNSMAIIIGDMINALGNKILFNSKFKADDIIKALIKLQDVISGTVIGQAQDFCNGYQGNIKEKDVLKVYENKTAKYSIEGPLHLGAILAGADEKILNSLSSYAIPIGIAFQIQDDILGIFGAEKKLGKTIGADITEGKQTLLVVKAKEKGNKNQIKTLNNLLGKKDLTQAEIKEFRNVILETGSLDYARNLARKLILESKKELQNLRINPEAKNFLLEIADFMIEREL